MIDDLETGSAGARPLAERDHREISRPAGVRAGGPLREGPDRGAG